MSPNFGVKREKQALSKIFTPQVSHIAFERLAGASAHRFINNILLIEMWVIDGIIDHRLQLFSLGSAMFREELIELVTKAQIDTEVNEWSVERARDG